MSADFPTRLRGAEARPHALAYWATPALLLVAAASCATPPTPAPDVAIDPPRPIDAASTVPAPDPPPKVMAAPNRCVRDLVRAEVARAAEAGEPSDLFTSALEAQDRGELDRARKLLLRLTEEFKKSALVPHAYLLFGEMFADEAAVDPAKWSIAVNFYREVMKYPPRENRAHFYATHRLAEAYRAQGQHTRALDADMRVLTGRAARPDAPCIGILAKRARRGMVASYVEAGTPQRALTLFKRATPNDDGMGLAVELVDAYAALGKEREATLVTRAIIQRGPDAATCAALKDVVRARGVGIDLSAACP